MKKYIDTFTGLLLVAMFAYLVSLTTGCHSRIHTNHHYDANGNLIHKDRTRAYSLFGKSEATRLQGDHEFSTTLAGKTNVHSRVSFGAENEKKSVDSEGLKAGGSAVGEAGGTILDKVTKP